MTLGEELVDKALARPLQARQLRLHAAKGDLARQEAELAVLDRCDQSVAGRDARHRVRTRGSRDPVLDVAGGQRDVARRAGGAAGGVDARDLLAGRAQVRAERVLARDRFAELPLPREGSSAMSSSRLLGSGPSFSR